MVTPEERVADVARRYDNDEGDLQRAALARLEWRRARSGKACARCHELKPTSAFSTDGRERDGLRRVCRACIVEANAEAYKRRRETPV